MRGLKKPMANAIYVALITAIYAAIFIASSEFVTGYDNLLSNSWWAAFIKLQNMKFVGIGMIGVTIIIDTLSALRRKQYDKYQIVLLDKVDCTYICTGVFCRNNFCTNFLSMGSNDDYRTMVSNHKLQNLIKSRKEF